MRRVPATGRRAGGVVSYARFGPGSDVYVYRSVNGDGYVCCGCSLDDWYTVDDPGEMLAHLHQHEEAGQMVPSHTLERLEREAAA